jgi:nucleotide-binding universal stress UspA family protein
VPFDGSAAAERVLRTACQAALAEGAPLLVLCVVLIPSGRAADETPIDARASVMHALVQATEICREEQVVATFRETYATNLADEILRIADERNAAVIALALGDESPGETELMSPTVQRVLARAHCTVLLQTSTTDQTDEEPAIPGASAGNGKGDRG